MTQLSRSESIVVAASPTEVYDLVSDVTRTGEWSPICAECWWEEDGGPVAGAWFGGRNRTPEREWETRSQVEVADPGREFAWLVAGAFARWGYAMAAVEGGTELTESWEFRPAGLDFFHEKYGEQAQAEIDLRADQAESGIPVTLTAIKALVEAG